MLAGLIPQSQPYWAVVRPLESTIAIHLLPLAPAMVLQRLAPSPGHPPSMKITPWQTDGV